MQRKMIVVALAPLLVLTAAGRGGEAGLDPRSRGDMALAQFGRTHPKCELWTNWRKLCSRTGPDGAVRCQDDPATQVRPSEPFCVAQGDLIGRWPVMETAAQWRSASRFCRDAVNRNRAFEAGEPRNCSYIDARPFSGLLIEARAHPWCGEWKEKATLRTIEPASKHRSTRAMAGQAGYYCAKRIVPRWCKSAKGFGQVPFNAPEAPEYYKDSEFVIDGLDYDVIRAVSGIYCGELR